MFAEVIRTQKAIAPPAVAERQVSHLAQDVGLQLSIKPRNLPCLLSVYTCCQVLSQ